MTQAQYLQKFDAALKLPLERKAEILEDIRAHFDEGLRAGASEDDLSAGLGDPETLAKEYRASYAAERAEGNLSAGNVFRAIWAGIGMGMLNLIFVLPFALLFFGLWLLFFIMGIGFALGGLAGAILSLVSMIVPLSFVSVSYPLVMVFGMLALCALGALLTIGMVYAGRALGNLVVRYIKSNIDIITGRRRNEQRA